MYVTWKLSKRMYFTFIEKFLVDNVIVYEVDVAVRWTRQVAIYGIVSWFVDHKLVLLQRLWKK